MSYVPGGQAIVDSATARAGDPRQTRMRIVITNRIGDWGTKILATPARARSRSFQNHESYITSAQSCFCEWSTARLGPRPDVFLPLGAEGRCKGGDQKHRKK